MSIVGVSSEFKSFNFTLKRNVENGFFLLEPIIELLKRSHEEQLSEDYLLSHYSVLVATTADGSKWIPQDKAIELLEVCDENGKLKNVVEELLHKKEDGGIQLDPEYVSSPLMLREAKEGSFARNEDEKVKLEVFLQKVLGVDVNESQDFDTVRKELDSMYPNVDFNFNVKVDEFGNTPLHWLASVGNITLVEAVVNNGADVFLGDNHGQSALVKAVKCINNYEHGTFEKLLQYLFPCLLVVDKDHRTIFHHIAIASGQSNYSVVSKYYLDVLMGFVVNTENPILKELDLKWIIANMLNVCDINGDTSLNIAARIGSFSLVETFMDYGADVNIKNKSGLSASDFKVTKDNENELSKGFSVNTETFHNDSEDAIMNNKEAKDILDSITSLLDNIKKDYKDELDKNNKVLSLLYEELNEKRTTLASSREQLIEAKQVSDESILLLEQIENLNNYINNDLESNNESVSDVSQPDQVNIETLLAVEPKSLTTEQLNQLTVHNETQKRYNEYLSRIVEGMGQKQSDLEGKFRRVLSLCLKIEEHKVDAMLDGLLQAISSEDPQDVDTDEMQHFLKKHARI